MWAKQKRKSGFTIVELLIVIVVIGILAAITIVSFNGVQAKAQNTASIDAASKYKRILMAYAAQNGQYPSGSQSVGYCLGTGYADLNNDSVGDCVYNGSGGYVSEDSTFSSALKSVASQPAVDVKLYSRTTDSAKVSGIRYDYGSDRTIDGKSNPFWIVYLLQGSSSKCGDGTVQISTWPAFVTNGGNPDVFGSSGVQCWLPLPSPN